MALQIIGLIVGFVGMYAIRDELAYALSFAATFMNAWFLYAPYWAG